jgi:hypothetical protein
MKAKHRFKFEWNDENGNLVAVTYSAGATSGAALYGARGQMFAKGYNPWHLSFVVTDCGEVNPRKKALTKAEAKRSISNEERSQSDFWWNEKE